MKDQLILLEELQRHDAKLREVEGALKALPEKLRSMQQDLAKVESMLEREKSQVADAEKWRRDQETSVKESEASIAKAKAKLQQSKGGKDFFAAQREVEAMRKQTSDKEEELLKMMEVIESGKKRVDAHEIDGKQLRDQVEREEAAIRGRLGEFEGQTGALRSERDVVAARVRADVMRKYNSIQMKRGLAVVPAKRGSCGGCNMAIPPQLLNILQRCNSIEVCPTCNRIVYWETIKHDAELERGEAHATGKVEEPASH